MEKPKPVTQTAKALALVAVVLLVCVPFLVIVSTSLASTDEVVANGGWVLWPTEPSLDAYRDILDGGIVTHALGVSAGVTVVGTLLSLACTVTLAYALSRPGVFGGRPVLLLVLFTFLFPPGMIPSFLLVKELGLLDSYASLVLPVLVNVFNLVVLRGFFQGIPEELYEAARLDGAGDWRVLFSVVLPLSKAALAVVGLFYAVAYWNSWFYGPGSWWSAHWPPQQVPGTEVVSPCGTHRRAVREGPLVSYRPRKCRALLISVYRSCSSTVPVQ